LALSAGATEKPPPALKPEGSEIDPESWLIPASKPAQAAFCICSAMPRPLSGRPRFEMPDGSHDVRHQTLHRPEGTANCTNLDVQRLEGSNSARESRRGELRVVLAPSLVRSEKTGCG
jgi:hypothetical protein